MITTAILASAATATQANQTTGFLALIFAIILVALIFDFFNGFHDAANSIATVVSTRVLSPTVAVIWAAFFNFIAAFLFGTAVAGTIGKGLINQQHIDVYVVLGGLTGAILWNIITWLLALPTSSSHALVGGVAGAALTKALITKAGLDVLIWQGWLKGWGGLLLFIVLSPTIGFLLGTINMTAVAWLFRRSTPNRVDGLFRRMQLVSSSVYSLGHGGNDAQKTMGIVVMLLMAAGLGKWTLPDPNSPMNTVNIFGHSHTVAWWIILSCNGAMAIGTMFGGWRIVKTMGSGITRLQPVGGCCAETAAATTIWAATHFGIPISTTHAITGSILGVGTTKGVRSVRWIWGQRIVMAWILTLPCSAFMAAIAYLVAHYILEPLLK
jgi:inorganic phosphate transporter, PiT family